MTCALLVTARNFSQRTQTVAPCAVALILCVLVLQTVNANEVIRFGTGGNEGSYFPVGSIIAVAINERRIKTEDGREIVVLPQRCLLYTSPSPRDQRGSRMPSSA